MPRVRVQRPDASLISKFPREFALYQQLSLDGNGEVDEQKLKEFYTSLYGSKYENVAAANELSFEEFAQLFAATKKTPLDGPGNCVAYAARDTSGVCSPYTLERRAVGDEDVRIQIAFCGMCHSDLHTVRNEWKGTTYPVVPGHEIVGFVTEVGSKVTKYKPGDRVGVGCFVNSCRNCEYCNKGEENYCAKHTQTYNFPTSDPGNRTYGGYSAFIVVMERFVVRVPDNLDLAAAAPLLCAGITTYSPLRHFGLDKPGMHIGVVGLGGLGHMAVQFAKAFGCNVTVISTSPHKEKEAKEVLGADNFLLSKDEEQLKAAAQSMDGIINTVSAKHDIAQLLNLLKADGTMVCVGAPPEPPVMPTFAMIFRRLRVAGSLVGGLPETQEMLDFCGKHNITCKSEVVRVDYINTAFERMLKNDVKYRFVLNIQGSLVQ